MKKSQRQLVLAICLSLIFATIVAMPMARAEENSDVSSEKINTEARQIEEILDPFLQLIDDMPEDVAEGDISEGVEWLNKNKGDEFKEYKFIADGENLKTIKIEDSNQIKTMSVWPCISSVGKALAVNVFPWSKILKVKQAAKLMGGLNSMTKTIITAYKHQRNLGLSKTNAIKKAVSISTKTLPGETQKAVLELFSLGDVVDSCF
ncbi:hypothetical protein SFC65_27730 [Priestia filamentosa]|uniref:hypothetical protein n=1 Tax=Priestia filamentosa TaxID=1402861 RepID=UPI003981E0A6